MSAAFLSSAASTILRAISRALRRRPRSRSDSSIGGSDSASGSASAVAASRASAAAASLAACAASIALRRRGRPSGLGVVSVESDESVTSSSPPGIVGTIQPMLADVGLHGRRYQIADRTTGGGAAPDVRGRVGQRDGLNANDSVDRGFHPSPGAVSGSRGGPGPVAAPAGRWDFNQAWSGSGAPGLGTTASRHSASSRSGSCQVWRPASASDERMK